LKIPALKESSLKTGSFAFCQKKKAPSVKQVDLRDILIKASKSVCTSMVVLFPDTLSPTPSTSSAIRTPTNIEQYPDDLELENEGDIQIEYYPE
jgi:hypothetical protein